MKRTQLTASLERLWLICKLSAREWLDSFSGRDGLRLDAAARGLRVLRFDIESGDAFTESVMALYAEATRKLGRVDGIVLPEMAISAEQFRALRAELPLDCFIVSGLGNRAPGEERGANEVRLSFPPHEEAAQKKHHPWKLDESQVVQCGLGGVLSPSIEWWEYAEFTDRSLKFIAINADWPS